MKNLLKNTLKCLCCIIDNKETKDDHQKLALAANNKEQLANKNNNSKRLTMVIDENDFEGTATNTENNNESNSQITAIGRDTINPVVSTDNN